MRRVIYLLILITLSSYYACSDEDDKNLPKHDPGKKVELTQFFPDSGGLATRVILEGNNFGSDTSQIKVYFNEKRATVINAVGDKMYVLAPRLPGDTCAIKVIVGEQNVEYPDSFLYKSQLTVTTIAGYRDAPNEFKEGPLSTTTFSQLTGIGVDKDFNIFVSMYDGWSGIAHISQENNLSTWLTGEVGAGRFYTPLIDPETQIVYFPCDHAHTFVELNPVNLWLPRVRQLSIPLEFEGKPIETNKLGHKHGFAYNPGDKHGYVRYYQGTIARFNLQTYEGEILALDIFPDNESFIAVDPLDPNILYLSFYRRHAIYTFDITTRKLELFAGFENTGGWRDGPRLDAEFKSPRQICFDEDGILYIADRENHCIRGINRQGIVYTVCGVPGQWGFVDGPADEARFDNPHGVAVDIEGNIYIAEESNNRSLRRLTVE